MATEGVSRSRQLDGLRGLAILGVIATHVWDKLGAPHISLLGLNLTPYVGLGGSGVVLFFVLSGYLLNGSIQRHFQERSLKKYWLRRAARIYPAYVIAIVFAVLVRPG